MTKGKGGEPGAPEPDWVQALMRDYQDKLTGGLYEAIYALEDVSAQRLMEGQARTCVSAFLELTGLPVPMELESFLEAMRTSGPSQIEIKREGAVIDWTELHAGECVCPLVRRRVVRLDARLCVCGAYWVKELFRTAASTEVEVETIETVATGAQNCRFRITVKREA